MTQDTKDSPIAVVDLPTQPGLYRLLSSSSTVYYVDARGPYVPEMYRAHGAVGSASYPHDDTWVRLTSLESICVSVDIDGKAVPQRRGLKDSEYWKLIVGRRHQFDFRVPGGYLDTTDFWRIQRVLERIERLDEMPPEGERTVEARVPHPPGA
ncbi:hypothetical protein [Demequina sp.]|uniref:hypothetical protein n=1 Tax=Demequina sp. TaxID=2050685 RepID=UPI003D09B659